MQGHWHGLHRWNVQMSGCKRQHLTCSQRPALCWCASCVANCAKASSFVKLRAPADTHTGMGCPRGQRLFFESGDILSLVSRLQKPKKKKPPAALWWSTNSGWWHWQQTAQSDSNLRYLGICPSPPKCSLATNQRRWQSVSPPVRSCPGPEDHGPHPDSIITT